jgi:hypothetical protein
MPRKVEKQYRGVFEREPGVWWIHYYDTEGKRRREKVGNATFPHIERCAGTP